MIRTIVAATDFSEPAFNAAVYACALAERFRAKLVLVNAFALPVGGYDSMAPYNILSEMKSSSVGALKELRSRLRPHCHDAMIECYSAGGTAEGVVLSAAGMYDADLVVMGMTSSAGALKRHVIGSAVLDVMNHTQLPVLVVPEGCGYNGIVSVTVACDIENERDDKFMKRAGEFCRMFGAPMEVLEVFTAQTRGDVVERRRSELRPSLAEIDHRVVSIYGEDPSGALGEHIRDRKPGLVILHPGRHGPLRRLFSSGVTEKLLYHIHTPLLLLQ